MTTITISKNHIEYNMQKYYIRNAASLFIGSYGEKRSPFGASAWLDEQGRLPQISFVPEVDMIKGVDPDEFRNSRFEYLSDSLRVGKTNLFKVSLNISSLIEMINQENDLIDRLLQLSSLRIVNQVFIVAENSASISKGTVIAYGLTELLWNEDNSEIVKSRNDFWGRE